MPFFMDSFVAYTRNRKESWTRSKVPAKFNSLEITSLLTVVTPSNVHCGCLDQSKISQAICAILLFQLASSDHSTSSDYDFNESVK